MPEKRRHTYKHRIYRNQTQKGGKHLYIDVNQITVPIIETVFCNGKRIADLPQQKEPLYVLKWGPPGSGKSSLDELIQTFGYPLDTYMDYNSDNLIEMLLPYRMQTAITKSKALRMQANYELREYAHVKELLQLYTSETNPLYGLFDKALVQRCKALYEEWESGQGLNPERKHALDDIIRDITNDETSAMYKYYRRNVRNSSGLSIQEKLKQVLRSAFMGNVNILDESTGAGYGEDASTQAFKDPLSGTRFSKRQMEKRAGEPDLIEIYINSKEALLGKILYNEQKEPIGIDTSSLTEDSIPMNYRIYVLYPILPKSQILQRVHRRALRKFTQPPEFTVPDKDVDRTASYANLLELYFKEMAQMLGGSKVKLREIVDRIVRDEQVEYQGSYTDYIQTLLTSIQTMNANSSFSTPMFSGIAQSRIEEAIEAAFHYSVDYFLKQYIIIGRIERVLYISTLGNPSSAPTTVTTDSPL